MDGVVGEVGGDQLDVAGVEGVVVAADPVERADLGIVTIPGSICGDPVRR